MVLTFEALIAPHTPQMFLAEVMGRAALHVTGPPGRFSELASWRTLNELLSFGGLRYPRLRLFRRGVERPEQTYATVSQTGSSRLLVRELTAALRGGATLAIEGIDEIREPVSDMCETLEEITAVPVQADLFASWGEPAVPAMLPNEHDVFIFQAEGRRKWRLRAPRADELGAESQPQPGQVDDGTTWSGTLNDGDTLYLPKGWYHCDEPDGGPSLAIAAKFRQPTGLDIVSWIAHQLSGGKLQSDIPRFNGGQVLSDYLTFFQREVVETVGKAGVLGGSLAEMKMVADPRVRFCLPWSAGEVPMPPPHDHHLVPLLRFPDACVRRRPDEDAFDVFVGVSPIRFPGDVFPVVERVFRSRHATVAQLLQAFEEKLPRERILQCVVDLIACGAVCLREAERLAGVYCEIAGAKKTNSCF